MLDLTQGQAKAFKDKYLFLEGGYTLRDYYLYGDGYQTNKGVTWNAFKTYFKGADKSFNYFETKLTDADAVQIWNDGFFKEYQSAPAPFGLILSWSKWGTGNTQNEVSFLQKKLGLTVDGQFGKDTTLALWLTADKQKLANELIIERNRFMQGLSNAAENPGWANGVEFLQNFSDNFFKKKD